METKDTLNSNYTNLKKRRFSNLFLSIATLFIFIVMFSGVGSAERIDAISSFNQSIPQLLSLQNLTRVASNWGSFHQEHYNGTETYFNVAKQQSMFALAWCYNNAACGSAFYQNRSVLAGSLIGADGVFKQINYSNNNNLREGSLEVSYAQQAFVLQELIDMYKELDEENLLYNVTVRTDLGFTGLEDKSPSVISAPHVYLKNVATDWVLNYTEGDGTNVSLAIAGSVPEFDVCLNGTFKKLVDANLDNNLDEYVIFDIKFRINDTDTNVDFRHTREGSSLGFVTNGNAFGLGDSAFSQWNWSMNGSAAFGSADATYFNTFVNGGENICSTFGFADNTLNFTVDWIEFTIDRKTPLLNHIKDVADFFVLNQDDVSYGYTRGRIYGNQAAAAASALYQVYNITGNITYKDVADLTFVDLYSRNPSGIIGEQNSVLDREPNTILHELGYDTYQMVSLGYLANFYNYVGENITLTYDKTFEQDFGYNGTETLSPSFRLPPLIHLQDSSTDWIVNSTSGSTNVSVAIAGTNPSFDVCVDVPSITLLDSDLNNYLDNGTIFNISLIINDTSTDIDLRHAKEDGSYGDITNGTNFGVGDGAFRQFNFSLNSTAPAGNPNAMYMSTYSAAGGNICTRFIINSASNISLDFIEVHIEKNPTEVLLKSEILAWINKTWEIENYWTTPDLKMQSGASTRTTRTGAKYLNNWYHSAFYFGNLLSTPDRLAESVKENFTTASTTGYSVRSGDNSGNYIRLYNNWNNSITADSLPIENRTNFVWNNSATGLAVVNTNGTTYMMSFGAATPSGGVISDVYSLSKGHLFSGKGGSDGFNGVPYGIGALATTGNCSNAWNVESDMTILNSTYPIKLLFAGNLTYINQTSCGDTYTTNYTFYDDYMEVNQSTSSNAELQLWSVSEETIGTGEVRGIELINGNTFNNATFIPLNFVFDYNDTSEEATWGTVDKFNASGSSFHYIVQMNESGRFYTRTNDYIKLDNNESGTPTQKTIPIYDLSNALIYNTNGSIYGSSNIADNDGNINITLTPNNASYVLDNFNLTKGVKRENDPIFNGTFINNTLDTHIRVNVHNFIALRNGRFTNGSFLSPSEFIIAPGDYAEVY